MISKITIDGLEIGMNSNYTLRRGIQGLEMFVPNNQDQRVPQSFVSRRTSNWGVGRVVTFPITIKGNTIAQVIANRKALASKLYPAQGQKISVLIYMQDDTTYRLDGYMEEFDAPMDRRNFNQATIAIKCDDARIFSQNTNSQVVGVLGLGTGIILPTEVPFTLPAGSGSQTVTNAGNSVVTPSLVINGPGTNFIINNVTTGQTLRIGYASNPLTLTTGQTVEIDGETLSITQAETNKFGAKDPSSEFITLQPGVNEISLEVESGSDTNTQVTLTWRDAYLGI